MKLTVQLISSELIIYLELLTMQIHFIYHNNIAFHCLKEPLKENYNLNRPITYNFTNLIWIVHSLAK